MPALARLPSPCLLLLALAACTVDDLPSAPDTTGGRGGVAGAGSSSGASGRSGAAGSSGQAGAGQAGEAGAGHAGDGGAGQAGTAGRAGAGGADPGGASGQGGVAGVAGDGGASGSSGQTGGSAGDGSSGQGGAGQPGAGQGGNEPAGSGGVSGLSGSSGQGGDGAGQSGSSGQGGDGGAGQSGSSGQSGGGAAQAGSAGQAGTGGSGGLSCATFDDCPGPQTECAQRACVEHVCTITYTDPGHAVATQTAGDCHRRVCDGEGGIVSIIDDTDPPASPNACVQSLCTSGVPSVVNAPLDTPCGQGTCDGKGNCFSCKTAADCGQNAPCYTWQCVGGGCQKTSVPAGNPATSDTPGDCKLDRCDGLGNVTTSVNNLDPPDDGNECTTNACASGVPTVTPRPGASCGAGTTQCGTCRPFQGGIACGACPAEAYCGATGCIPRKNGGACASPSECASGSCLNGTCESCGKYPNAPGCLCLNKKKDPGETFADCGGDSCGPCPSGKPCQTAYDCASGRCAGNVCL